MLYAGLALVFRPPMYLFYPNEVQYRHEAWSDKICTESETDAKILPDGNKKT